MGRITIRFNDVEEEELRQLKVAYGIADDSKAIKFAIKMSKKYLDNVTELFFPSDYDVILYKKTKGFQRKEKVRLE